MTQLYRLCQCADASITNSNSNFGTFSLLAEGFKKEAFAKDNKGFITSIITPRSVVNDDQQIEFLQIDVSETTATKLFLFAQPTLSLPPAHIAQGFRIGARSDEKLYIDNGGSTFQATVVMPNGASGTSNIGEKNYEAIHSDASASTKSVFTINAGHELANGESKELSLIMVIYPKILIHTQYILQLQVHKIQLLLQIKFVSHHQKQTLT